MNMHKITCIAGLACCLIMAASCAENAAVEKEDVLKYVNPFVGNADNGHTFPGACYPFGMIQASPETGNDSWRYCSGFNYNDTSILGFAQTHLNGTGSSDLGDTLLLPLRGVPQEGTVRAPIDKASQVATPGYYSVTLPESDIRCEMTATDHSSHYAFTYGSSEPEMLLVDLQSGIVNNQEAIHNHVLEAEMNMPDDRTITGHNQTRNWVTRHYYYVIKFSKPYKASTVLAPVEGEKAQRLVLEFDHRNGDTLQVKVGMSSVSIEGAMANLEAENSGWDFGKTRALAEEAWRELLSPVAIDGTDDQKSNFYTSLYHLYIQPNNIADVDGRFRGPDDSVHTASMGKYFSTYSLWDTYRAANPLLNILVPSRVPALVETMIEHYKIQGYLPIWSLWGKENFGMIGNHGVPTVADAYLKGLLKGIDAEEAYEAVKATLTVSHPKSDWETFDEFGYYPFDKVTRESVSRTLETCYDNYCAALMAKSLGKEDDYALFSKRAGFYKNLFDPEYKLMRGRDSEGQWRTPFDPFMPAHVYKGGGDYTEGNAWQYTWHVQHDVPGLIEMMGGKEAFATKLDSLFFLKTDKINFENAPDVTGLIGQYAHGNEPSHHVIYLYEYAGQPWKTQELVREVFDKFYKPEPEGLCGNDDCGQMSAWYIFSAMGFYPVDPVSGKYVLGAPQIKEISINLENGKTFTVKADDLSEENKYVASVTLNGNPVNDIFINYEDIIDGGVLEFQMTSQKPAE